MKILDRYILFNFIKIFFTISFTFTSVFIFIDLFDRLPRILSYQETVSVHATILYFATRIPYTFILGSPLIMILSGLFLMDSLSKHNETIAVRSAGISIIRMNIIIIIFGIVFSLLMMTLGDYILSKSFKYNDYLYNVKIKNMPIEDNHRQGDVYYKSQNTLYNIGFFDGYKNILYNINILQFIPENGEVEKIIFSPRAIWENDKWTFYDCQVKTFKNSSIQKEISYDKTNLDLVEVTPADFVSNCSNTERLALNYQELNERIVSLKKIGGNYAKELVDLKYKISFPLINLIVLFFCFPMATSSSRNKNRGLIFLMGITICFVFLYVTKVCQNLGYLEVISPDFAAWFPVILFSLIGIIFMIKAEI